MDEAIGCLIRKAREVQNISQAELAEKAGFKHYQIVSRIEIGRRPLKIRELESLARALHLELYDFIPKPKTKPEDVIWINEPSNSEPLKVPFVRDCKSYHDIEGGFGPMRKFPTFNTLHPDIEVGQWGERVRQDLGLGIRPAVDLTSQVEEVYGIKVFHEQDMAASGAATWGSFGPAVLLAAKDPPARRHLCLAHLLFYLMAWECVDIQRTLKDPGKRVLFETLGNIFARNLLLPKEPLLTFWSVMVKGRGRYIAAAEAVRFFMVPAESVLDRLVELKIFQSRTPGIMRLDQDFAGLIKEMGSWQAFPTPGRFSQRYTFLKSLSHWKSSLSPEVAQKFQPRLRSLLVERMAARKVHPRPHLRHVSTLSSEKFKLRKK